VEVERLWDDLGPHGRCALPHEITPDRYAWFLPDVHGWRPPRQNLRWRPSGPDDLGISYEAVLQMTHSDLPVNFVGWARSAVAESQARITANRKSPHALRRMIGDLEKLPVALQNANTRTRLKAAQHALTNNEQIREVVRGDRPPAAPTTQYVRVVYGGLPSLGRRHS